MRIGPGDHDFPCLQGLSQAVENLRRELREFLEKKNTVVGERNFARFDSRPAANERRHAGSNERAA